MLRVLTLLALLGLMSTWQGAGAATEPASVPILQQSEPPQQPTGAPPTDAADEEEEEEDAEPDCD